MFDQFYIDFATELDIFDSVSPFPQWIFDYRDDLIRKISSELRKICYDLKQRGLTFKIKHPVEIDGKWKFADIFFHRQNTVLIVADPMKTIGRPCWRQSDRSEFFKDRFRVVEVESLQELQLKIQMKNK